MNLSVVIPVYNERETLPKILAELLRHMPPAAAREIIVVDDCSMDGTREWLTEQVRGDIGAIHSIALDDRGGVKVGASSSDSVGLRVRLQPRNSGKGAALRAGFALARHEVIVVQDADLEYDPADLNRMYALMSRGVADVVYGTRFASSPHRSLYLHHRLANWLISSLVNVLCNSTLNDVEVCYKMFRREVLDGFALVSNDFGFEVEFTIKMLLARRWRVYEVGISYYGRNYAEGKKINWKDGVKALWYIFRFRFFA
ncbi:MAG: glycosyltransferase family 2 protein [Alphaproteobacteria bacterium]|nr:glycosyltransferase family 2 protein [Alphaproteobacteria bacterium]